jgi:hypothetical protein
MDWQHGDWVLLGGDAGCGVKVLGALQPPCVLFLSDPWPVFFHLRVVFAFSRVGAAGCLLQTVPSRVAKGALLQWHRCRLYRVDGGGIPPSP